MRFSLLHLLLFFPAWCFAYLVAPFATGDISRITWRHDVAANDIRQIRLYAENAIHDNASLSFNDFDFTELWIELGDNFDPWGNPYRLVERNEHADGFKSTVHAYSLGQDGETQTDGNDLDDINSWNYDRQRYYGAQIALDDRKTYLIRTLWLTPLVYLAMVCGYRTIFPLYRVA